MTDRKDQIETARNLRDASTPPEVVLWSDLRGRKLRGLKFRRQHPLGPFVADFYCAEAKLVVELDGSCHRAKGAADAARDRWMSERGIETLRVPVSLFSKNRTNILREILRIANHRADRLKKD